MNLELKLAAYLPYGLKILRPDNKTILEAVGLIGNFIVFNEETGYTYGVIGKYNKPILRPLDLEKEIEVNGEKFIPIEKIAIYGNNKGYLEEAILTGLVEVIVFNMLLSWHFDVFGLIEAGLAIDINTLTT